MGNRNWWWGCYYNILRSIIEVWPNEVIGDLIGKRVKNRFILTNSYPWLTAIRKPSTVYHGNYTARRRVVEAMRVISKKGGLSFSIVGCYHSHPFSAEDKRSTFFGENHDLVFFSDEMRQVDRTESVMIVASVKSRDYRSKQVPGEYVSKYEKSLRILLKDNLYHGYDIILTAFFLSLKNKRKKLKKLKIRLCHINVREKEIS